MSRPTYEEIADALFQLNARVLDALLIQEIKGGQTVLALRTHSTRASKLLVAAERDGVVLGRAK